MSALFLSFVLTACASRSGKMQPGWTVLNRYLTAVEKNDGLQAYRLMGKGYRKKVSQQTFLKYWSLYREELLEQARKVRKALAKQGKFQVYAEAGLKDGTSTSMVWDKGWRLRGGTGTDVGGGSPLSTLLALVKALDNKDLGAFLKLLTERRREKFLRALLLRLQKLKANLDRPIVITGRRIRFQYDSRFYIDLINENGVWKIYDFN